MAYSSLSNHLEIIIQLDTIGFNYNIPVSFIKPIARCITSPFTFIITSKLSAQNKLKDEQLQICCNNIKLEIVAEWKLLGLTINEHLPLSNHISKLLKDSYFLMCILKKTQTIHVTVGMQTVRRIVNLVKIILL